MNEQKKFFRYLIGECGMILDHNIREECRRCLQRAESNALDSYLDENNNPEMTLEKEFWDLVLESLRIIVSVNSRTVMNWFWVNGLKF